MLKIPLTLSQRFLFAGNVPCVELEPEKISVSDAIMPGEFNPHKIRLWVLGDISGAICAVWADCEQDAWDKACDENFLDSYQIAETDPDLKRNEETGEETLDNSMELMRLGNASEPFAFDQAWMAVAPWEKQAVEVLVCMAHAIGAQADTLEDSPYHLVNP